MGDTANAYKIVTGKSEGKRLLDWPIHRWKDNIKMNLKETGVGGCGLASSGLGQEHVVGSCEHGKGISSSIKGWEFLCTIFQSPCMPY
jgi:hypothetical protein